MQVKLPNKTVLRSFGSASSPAHCLCRKFLLCSCYHVKRITGINSESELCLNQVDSRPPSDLPTSWTFTFFAVKSCLVLSTYNFHTFRLMPLNAHLTLWTFLPSEHWNNPISFSNCDAWIWAAQDSHCANCRFELPASWTVHVLSQVAFRGEEAEHTWIEAAWKNKTGQVMWQFTCHIETRVCHCQGCLCRDFLHTDLVPLVQCYCSTYNTKKDQNTTRVSQGPRLWNDIAVHRAAQLSWPKYRFTNMWGWTFDQTGSFQGWRVYEMMGPCVQMPERTPVLIEYPRYKITHERA